MKKIHFNKFQSSARGPILRNPLLAYKINLKNYYSSCGELPISKFSCQHAARACMAFGKDIRNYLRKFDDSTELFKNNTIIWRTVYLPLNLIDFNEI